MFDDAAAYVPDMTRLAGSTSELRDLVDRFALDRQALQRFYTVPGSNERRGCAFQRAWLDALPKIGSRSLRVKDRSITSCCAITSSISLLLDREERYERETDPLPCSKRTSSSSRKTGRSCGS